MNKLFIISIFIFSYSFAKEMYSEFDRLDYLQKRYALAITLKSFHPSGIGFGAPPKSPGSDEANEIYKKAKDEYEIAIKEYFAHQNSD